ncbi:hypothetical protein SDC9_99429 [bioreactor metagenome]|uniref:Uncharacterized protein n=1 Tax=bioreactor metagenome TaxID=1076179 RepID=A0A645AHL5_9ZZZZ
MLDGYLGITVGVIAAYAKLVACIASLIYARHGDIDVLGRESHIVIARNIREFHLSVFNNSVQHIENLLIRRYCFSDKVGLRTAAISIRSRRDVPLIEHIAPNNQFLDGG